MEHLIGEIFSFDSRLDQSMQLSLSMEGVLHTIKLDHFNRGECAEYNAMMSVLMKHEQYLTDIIISGNTVLAAPHATTAPAAAPQESSTASVWDTDAAEVKKTSRMSDLTNLKNKFKNDCTSATFTLNSVKFEDMGPVYAKVQQTVASMPVSLKTIQKDHNDRVPNDQILN